jgi:hypothetical protein
MAGMGDPDAAEQVAWPAVVRRARAKELVLVRSLEEWRLDPELHARPFGADDRLIDSAGREYVLRSTAPARAVVVATEARSTPAQLHELAERHLAASGRPAEWLAAFLSDVAEAQRWRATILYLLKTTIREASGPDE